jgi:hypothetical protein
MTQYVELSDDQSAVVTIFHGPQDSSDKPNYAELGDNDARVVAFNNAIALEHQQRTAMASGIQITSTANSAALDATYGIDDASRRGINSIVTGINAHDRVPGGGSTFNYPDMNGDMHAFSAADFLNFSLAVSDYVYAIDNGTFPPQPVVIP